MPASETTPALRPVDFPGRQVLILAFAMAVNSFTLASLYPYVGTMVKELRNLQTTNEAGFYTGYLASAFTFGRLASSYVWGYLSDSVGRKPVIVTGLLSMAIGSVSFGLSTSYTWAISTRLIIGLTSGILPALRTTVREVCGPEHVVRGMTYFSGAKGTSMFIGAGIGGVLAQPAVHFPEAFSGDGLFGRFGFLLPNLVGAGVSLVVLVLVVAYIPETKDYAAAARHRAAPQGRSSGGGANGVGELPALGDDGGGAAEDGVWEVRDQGPGVLRLLALPHVKVVLFMACMVQSMQIGLEEVFPLFALSTPNVGGLGWNTMQIGQVLVGTGFVVALFQLVVFPPCIKVVGITWWQRLGGIAGIPARLAVPAVKTLSWNYGSLVLAAVASNSLAFLSVSAINLGLVVGSTTLVPSEMRGKLGGLYNTAECIGRFLGPTGYAIAYAWSVSPSTAAAGGYGGLVDYRFVFYASAVSLALVAALGWKTLTTENLVPKHGAPVPQEEKEEGEDGEDGGVGAGGRAGEVSRDGSRFGEENGGSGSRNRTGGGRNRGGGRRHGEQGSIDRDYSFVSTTAGTANRKAEMV